MKKNFLFLTLMTCLILILLNIQKKENMQLVFNEKESYSIYILTFPNKNLSTNNFNDYFLDKKIIWIEPYINDLYGSELIKYKRYYFQYTVNIDMFKNKFIAYMDKLGYRKESIKLKIDGILIKKLKIHCTDTEIEVIKSKIDNVLVDKIG